MKRRSTNTINPQIIQKATARLPSITTIGTYEDYEREKRSRKDIEKRRKMLQQSVRTLRREADCSIKNYRSTQDSLMSTYNKKMQMLNFTNKKNQQRKRRQQQLQKRKNYSSLSRYLHQVKKQEAINGILGNKKQKIKNLKSFLDQAQAKKQKQRELRMSFVKQQTKKMSETQKARMKWTRQNSFLSNKNASMSVRSNLIDIQQSLISKQKATIQKLQQEKQIILGLLQKNKEKHSEVKSMKDELDGMTIYDFQSRVLDNKKESRISVATRKIDRSKRRNSRNKEHLNYF